MDIMYECICVCIAGDPAKNSKLVLLTKDGLSVGIGDVCLEQDVLHGRSIPREYIKIQIDYIKPGTSYYLQQGLMMTSYPLVS